jgi:hypothetical protein
MSAAAFANPTTRAVIAISGEEARAWLGGLITQDIDLLDKQRGIFAGLLSPQGKILFDFFVTAGADGALLLDVDASRSADLVKRLGMYKLRAKVAVEDVSATHEVGLEWGEVKDGWTAAVSYRDPRHPGLGFRYVDRRQAVRFDLDALPRDDAGYEAMRIALGVPEGGKDYDWADAFPHEANFDLVHGVSFTKGCYIGQEIVARMQHRGTVRKRVSRVVGAADLSASRPEVTMGDVAIGRLGSVAGRQGLALVRLDRAIEAIDKGIPITAGGIAITIDPDMIARQREIMAGKAAGA